MANKPTTCPICNREITLTFHHYIPRTLHDNKWFKKNFPKEQLQSNGVFVCRLCHDAIHNFWDEKTLGKEYNSFEKLMATEQMQKHAKWAIKQKV